MNMQMLFSSDSLKIPLIEFPVPVQAIIFLLKEDIKSEKFFSSLRALGLTDSIYQSDLSSLILTSIGLESDDDETINLYIALLKKYSAASESSNSSFTEQAFHLYTELMMAKEQRSK